MGYKSGDWRTPGQLPPKVAAFMQWSQTNPQIQAITADPRYAGNTPAQRRVRQAAIHRVIVSAGQHIPDGLKINADGKLETDDQSGIPAWGKALILGGAAAGAFFGAPALLGAFGAGGAEAGAAGAAGAGSAGAAGTGAAAALGPSTAASLAETAGIVGGSSVPASLAGLSSTELAGLGTAAGTAGVAGGTAAAGGAGVGPMIGGTAVADFTGPMAPAVTGGSSSWLGGVGKFLGSTAGGSAISAGANLAGAAIQSHANTKAAEIAAQTAREALAYEKQRDTYAQQLEASRYGDLTSRLTPYISSGQNANARMAQILGLPTPDTAPMGTPPTPMGQTPAAGTAGPRPGGSLVTMKAPDGSIKQIALEAVNHYLSKGAQVVG